MKNAPIFYFTISLFFLFTCSSAPAQDFNNGIQFSQHVWLPAYNLKKIGNSTLFQGNNKNRNYFEGWYFKMVSEDGTSILSVIPGISLSKDGKEQHAFIQTIDGVTAHTNYYSFPIEDFSFSTKEFAIKIGANYFSKERIILDLKDQKSTISGTIEMCHPVDYTSGQLLNRGIMGWYRFVPFMECYHGVVSLTHELKGKLVIDNKTHDFENGKGYIEKDWGSSMPSAWIWMQSNHFNDAKSSIMLSIADIPWMGKSFTGFLGFFYHNNQIHRFATYRHTKLQLKIDESNVVNIKIKNGKNTFILTAKSNNTGLLKAPTAGSMDRRIPESIDAKIVITMIDDKGHVLFSDSTTIAGLEMVGNYQKLQGLLK